MVRIMVQRRLQSKGDCKADCNKAGNSKAALGELRDAYMVHYNRARNSVILGFVNETSSSNIKSPK